MTEPNITYLVHEAWAEHVVPPGASASYALTAQVGLWRPCWLRIEPEIAPSFLINDVYIGQRSQFPRVQTIPASQFMHGKGADIGDDFPCETILPGMDFVLSVTNVGDRALPFRATWKCYRGSQRAPEPQLQYGGYRTPWQQICDQWQDAKANSQSTEAPHTPPASPPAPLPVARVASTSRSKRTIVKRDPPGFGWDPDGED